MTWLQRMMRRKRAQEGEYTLVVPNESVAEQEVLDAPSVVPVQEEPPVKRMATVVQDDPLDIFPSDEPTPI